MACVLMKFLKTVCKTLSGYIVLELCRGSRIIGSNAIDWPHLLTGSVIDVIKMAVSVESCYFSHRFV